MLCGQMDAQLKELARRTGCTYTRYADDISFSTKEDRFHPGVAYRDALLKRWVIGDQLARIIADNFFAINSSKTRVCSRRTRLEVTGLTIKRSESCSGERSCGRSVQCSTHGKRMD